MENPSASGSSALDRAAVCIATGLYASTLPTSLLNRFKNKSGGQSLIDKRWTGAGLFGSIEGALTYLALPTRLANAWWMIVLGTGIAVYFSGRAERVLNSQDDSRIIIDEWIGAWIALWGLGHHRFAALVLAVVLFRLFDVFKGPIGNQCQKLPGGWGVTFDDVYAGLAANFFWRVAVLLFPRTL